MLPILQLGPLALQTPGLILLLGLWLGLFLTERLAPRYKTNANLLYNLVFTALVAGVIGARLTYAARFIDVFISAPLNLLSLTPGLLDPTGGVAVGLIAALIYGNRKNIPLWPTLDALTPLLAILAVSTGLAHLASGDAFGAPTNLPWGIELWGMKRHPVQIYEILAAILILGTIWPRKGASDSTPWVAGEKFWQFLALSAAARLFLETFRGDSLILIGDIRTAQVLAWMVLAVSLWGWGSKSANRQMDKWQNG